MKLLTDKTKAEFFEWLIIYKAKGNKLSIYQKGDILNRWYSSDLEDKIGVLILYFDSVGIIIEFAFMGDDWLAYINDDPTHKIYHWESRQQAWVKAIERANELRNKQLKNT